MHKKRLSFVFLVIVLFISINVLTPNVKTKNSIQLHQLGVLSSANDENYNDTIIYPPGPTHPFPYELVIEAFDR